MAVDGGVTDVPGLRVGHWTDTAAATGCTVVLFPEGTVGSGEVRGGAPATRETALLDPTRTVSRLDALVLTGGSAFGLASADGVVRFCEERGMGFPTPAGPVPIVVALGLFDLMVGDPTVRPGPEAGYAACVAAGDGPVAAGLVGAGTGATVAAPPADVGPGAGGGVSPGPGIEPPTAGPGESAVSGESAVPGVPARVPGGLVTASARVGELVVAALVVVNAAGAPGAGDESAVDLAARAPSGLAGFGNTTVGLVATNATLDKVACHLVAQAAHDGLARAVFPAHTRSDGDAFVVAAVGGVPATVDAVTALATHVVARAIGSLAGRSTGDLGR
jgi:L-aminopeptidase/D-esterase-like protein